MIIACPACETRYVVPDSAIGIEGRTVRCAKCKHSWFQDGPDPAAMAQREAGPVPTPNFDPAPAPTPQPAPASAPAPRPQPVAAAPQEPEAEREDDQPDGPDFDETEPPSYTDDRDVPRPPEPQAEDRRSRFDHAPPFRPHRNTVKLWTWAAAIFAVLALGTVAAVNTIGLPDWVPVQQPLFGVEQPDLELEFPAENHGWRELSNGTYLFSARIVVRNTARESRDIPQILIVLRDQRERIVYSWVVDPSQNSLAPGEELVINEATTDIPRNAVFADIGWAPR